MDVFRKTIVWHDMLFALTARGDIYRLWFRDDTHPLMQRLFRSDYEYEEPIRALEKELHHGIR